MSNKKIDSLVVQMESHLECWKQFAHYINMARAKKFELEDEAQFLEIKSVITQELELIMAAQRWLDATPLPSAQPAPGAMPSLPIAA